MTKKAMTAKRRRKSGGGAPALRVIDGGGRRVGGGRTGPAADVPLQVVLGAAGQAEEARLLAAADLLNMELTKADVGLVVCAAREMEVAMEVEAGIEKLTAGGATAEDGAVCRLRAQARQARQAYLALVKELGLTAERLRLAGQGANSYTGGHSGRRVRRPAVAGSGHDGKFRVSRND